MDSNQINLIKDAINLSITQLDYLGGNKNKILELQKLRESIKNTDDTNKVRDNHENVNVSDFYIKGTESILLTELKLAFIESCQLIEKDSIKESIFWLTNPAPFQGTENLNKYSESETSEENPTLVLVKMSSQQLHYFSLFEMYHIWLLCQMLDKIKSKKVGNYLESAFSNSVEQFQDDMQQSFEYIKKRVHTLKKVVPQIKEIITTE